MQSVCIFLCIFHITMTSSWGVTLNRAMLMMKAGILTTQTRWTKLIFFWYNLHITYHSPIYHEGMTLNQSTPHSRTLPHAPTHTHINTHTHTHIRTHCVNDCGSLFESKNVNFRDIGSLKLIYMTRISCYKYPPVFHDAYVMLYAVMLCYVYILLYYIHAETFQVS